MMNTLKGLAIASLMACVLVGCATGGSSNPLAGTWNFTVESQLGTLEQVVMFNDDMTGMIKMEEPAPAEMVPSNVMIDGDKVTFDVVFDIEGQELPAQFVGTLDGDSITGEYVTDLGNGTVTGSRAE